MHDGWRETTLREVLALDLEKVPVDPAVEYDLAGVFSFGKGLFRRDPLLGSRTSYSHLNRLRKDQFVMSKLKAWEGAITVVENSFDGCVLSPEFPTYSLDESKISPSFLRLTTIRPHLWRLLAAESRGVGGRKERVHQLAVLNVSILLPPLAEQRRIVDLIAAVDAAIEAAEYEQRTLETARISLLERLLGSENNHASSEHFVSIGSLLTDTVGGVWGSEPGVEEMTVLVCRSTEFRNDGSLDLSTAVQRSITNRQLARRKLAIGDILLEKSGGGPKQPVGRVVIVDDIDRAVVCSNFVQLLRPDTSVVDPTYLFNALWYLHVTGHTHEYQSHTTGIRNLRTNGYLAKKIALPRLDQQLNAVDLMKAHLSGLHSIVLYVTNLKRLRSALLADLLSGDHEIPDSYDQLLSA